MPGHLPVIAGVAFRQRVGHQYIKQVRKQTASTVTVLSENRPETGSNIALQGEVCSHVTCFAFKRCARSSYLSEILLSLLGVHFRSWG